jgi:hypothetical protein
LALFEKNCVDFLQPCVRLQTGLRLLQNGVFLCIKNSEDFAWVRYRGVAMEEIDADLMEHSEQHRSPVLGLKVCSRERS